MLDGSKFLDEEEDAKLINTLRSVEEPWSLFFGLLRRYGMRSNELLAVRVQDIDCKRRKFRVKGSKGSKPREFPLDQEFFSRLWNQARQCLNDNDLVFPFKYYEVQYRWDLIKVHLSPVGQRKPLHSLRHTCGIEIYRRFKDIRRVQNVLGHRSITSTMVYLDFVSSEDEFRETFVNEEELNGA